MDVLAVGIRDTERPQDGIAAAVVKCSGRGQRWPYQAICVPSGDQAGSCAVPHGDTVTLAAAPAPDTLPTATAITSVEPTTTTHRPSRIMARE